MPLELREYKEEFDFLHKKTEELEWEQDINELSGACKMSVYVINL